MTEYVALDLETTGLEPSKDRIIEIGAVKVREKKVVGEYSTLINPQMKISENITELTGISNDMVMGKPYITDVLGDLLNFCEDLPLLGHNLLFDYSFVKHQTVNAGMKFEKMGVDTLKLARVLLPELPSKSLQKLRIYYEIPQKNAHRALEDARTTFLLYERLREEFEEKESKMFQAVRLLYKVKKHSPITASQKRYLQDLIKYHKIELDRELESLTRNEASREIDKILSNYGKIMR